MTCPTPDAELRAVLACLTAAFGQVQVISLMDVAGSAPAAARQPALDVTGDGQGNSP
jgi:hypothetical protein